MRSSDGLDIYLRRGTAREQQTADQLRRLMQTYSARKFVFTTVALVEEGGVPFSHPLLRLNSRHLDDDLVLLSVFIHEQLHWFAVSRAGSMRKAIAELRLAFPSVPIGAPDGARDEQSSYLHLVINYLEYEAMKEILGEPSARVMIERLDFYRGLYRLVLNNSTAIRNVVDRYGLRPTAPCGHVA